MGLDIAYYANVKHAPERSQEDDDVIVLHNERCFANRSDDLVGGTYTADHRGSFRAGSYSGYNEWRERLSNLFLKADPEKVWNDPGSFDLKPFYEIVNFTDSDGFIGPKTALKLYRDFEAGEAQAQEAFDEYGFDLYQEFKEAFRVAGHENGIVQFA